jgi:hypothetical protein
MSRAYRISCSESRTEVVRVEDGVCTELEVIDVLPKEEMGELLAKELAERGFEREGKMMRRIVDGVTIEVDLSKGSVTARVVEEKSVDASASQQRAVQQDTEEARRALKEAVDRDIKRQIDAERGKMTDALAAKLEKALRDVKNDLDRASARATAAGLKVKASRLGEIEEVSEDPETGSITIKVRV